MSQPDGPRAAPSLITQPSREHGNDDRVPEIYPFVSLPRRVSGRRLTPSAPPIGIQKPTFRSSPTRVFTDGRALRHQWLSLIPAGHR